MAAVCSAHQWDGQPWHLEGVGSGESGDDDQQHVGDDHQQHDGDDDHQDGVRTEHLRNEYL